jgi:hypothetical protein
VKQVPEDLATLVRRSEGLNERTPGKPRVVADRRQQADKPIADAVCQGKRVSSNMHAADEAAISGPRANGSMLR